MKIELTEKEELLLAESRTINNEAYDAYMKGIYYWDQLTQEGLQNAYEYFTIAVQKDPDWDPPYAGLAIVWGTGHKWDLHHQRLLSQLLMKT